MCYTLFVLFYYVVKAKRHFKFCIFDSVLVNADDAVLNNENVKHLSAINKLLYSKKKLFDGTPILMHGQFFFFSENWFVKIM